jgi:hypothetical protein
MKTIGDTKGKGIFIISITLRGLSDEKEEEKKNENQQF